MNTNLFLLKENLPYQKEFSRVFELFADISIFYTKDHEMVHKF